ncbi:Tetratricopeptide TPR_2 repeat protein [Anaeromyxobacter dehalogenans 2CP-1]|uniref:Tetratricopeptide TPR_2 repeat protein n=1 Tax=Anaeromyxobacter dehalogenans (strain ATCC BAA-258 / DSM 21875 / 2CP-1) TaxID=455488 RepID=B8JFH0_ANAD2|nr:tetratricopeptide repeat protein [Anaeromyxobacter dehalogenans]ACL66347.1 Tetratricopeptide TPR_2 repeat protein [Anaeromyxobacter dehalogenans 2CP-1]
MRPVAMLGMMLLASTIGCATARKPDVLGAQRALASELVARKDWPAAFAAADGLCRGAPGRPEGYLLRGIVYREQGLQAEAEADLREALRLERKLAAAHSALAILYDTQGRSAEAQEHHRQAAELEPRNAGYLNNVGFSLFAHGRAREAIPVLHEALRAAPADARIRNNLGFAYAASGDLSRAAEQFERGGSPAQAKNNMGWAYERRGARAQAFDAYVESVRADPGAPAARENLARLAKELQRDLPSDLATPGGV